MVFKTLIGVNSLQEMLGGPLLTVVDCRFDLMNPDAGRDAYLRAHIPTARYADLNRDLSAPVGAHTGRHPLPAPEAFAAWLNAIGVGQDTQVVAYDDANGSIAARLWWLLRWAGHGAAAVLDGGFKAWTAAGGTLQSGGHRFDRRQSGDAPFHAANRRKLRFEHRPSRAGPAGSAHHPGRCARSRTVRRRGGAHRSVAGHVPGAVKPPLRRQSRRRGSLPPRRRARASLAGASRRQVARESGRHVRLRRHRLSQVCSVSKWPAWPAPSCTPVRGANGFATRGVPVARG